MFKKILNFRTKTIAEIAMLKNITKLANVKFEKRSIFSHFHQFHKKIND